MKRSPCSAISFIFRRMYLHMNNRLFSRKDLVRLIIPLIVDQFLQVAVGLSDSIMVARVGEAAVSGVCLVDTVMLLIINIFTAPVAPLSPASISAEKIRRPDVRRPPSSSTLRSCSRSSS